MAKILKNIPIGITLLSIVFLLIQVGSDLYIPTLTANIVNLGVVPNDTNQIYYFGKLMIIFSLLSFSGALLNTFLASIASNRLGKRLRHKIYGRVMSFTVMDFDKFGISSLITRSTNDVVQVQTLVEMGLKFLILAPLYFIGGIYLSYQLSPELTKIYLYFIPFVILGAFIILGKTNKIFGKLQKQLDKLNLVFKEGLTGIKVIYAFNKEQYENQRYEGINHEYTNNAIKGNVYLSFLAPFTIFLLNIAVILVIWVGGHNALAGNLEIGSLMGVITYSTQISMSVIIITNILLTIPKGKVSSMRINEILNVESAFINEVEVVDVDIFFNSLEFNDVDFKYNMSERKILEDINFSVKKGESLAFIGSTGSGKSTITKLITRFYDPTSGEITIDGINTQELPQKYLRDHISTSLQKNVLFYGTIRENLQVAKADATDEEIWNALEIMEARSFVEEKGEGLDYIVEKQGSNFSGGQKQRLVLARTLLKQADIYIFDDSFSALDYKTDSLIQANLADILRDKIKIVVAQRITSVKNADKIVVLDEGKIVGYGTNSELEKNNEIYQEIIASQEEQVVE